MSKKSFVKVSELAMKVLCPIMLVLVLTLGIACDGGGGGGDNPTPPPNPSSYSISGRVISNEVGLSGVNITLSGGSSATTTTDSNGEYSFTGLSNGNYTVTPSQTPYTFSPEYINIAIADLNQTGQDFIASIISDTAKVLDDTTTQALSSVSSGIDNSITFIFSATTSQLYSLAIGDVMVVGVTDLTPYGILCKVGPITRQRGGGVEVSTTQATLEEIITKGSVETSAFLTSSNLAKAVPLQEGVICESRVEGFFIKFTDVVLYDDDGDTTTINDQIRANGSLSLNPSFGFSAEFDNGLKKLDFTNTTTETAELEIYAEANILNIDIKKPVPPIPAEGLYFNPIIIWVGYVPVILTPKLTIYVGVNGDISVGITTSVTQEATLTLGVTYENNNWSPVHSFSNDFQYNLPELYAGCSLKGYVKPQLELLLYGVIGPYANIEGYLELNADPLAIPWWVLYGGISSYVGVEIEVFSHVIAGYSSPDLIGFEKILAQAEVPPPPSADFTATPRSGNKPLSVQFTDESTGNITSWFWNFGDGVTSNTRNPPHTYNSTGYFTVTLTVTGPYGQDSESKNNYIYVAEAIETVSTPNTPSGSTSREVNQSGSYATGGSTCSIQGHNVQYRFDWGDGTNSGWLAVESTTSNHSWSKGTYQVKTKARCATNTSKQSNWSSPLQVTVTETPVPHTVSKPNTPSGSTSLQPNQDGTYCTGGSTCSQGHSIKYGFWWDDGTTTGLLPVGQKSASHHWGSQGGYRVLAIAACSVDNSVASDFSDFLTVSVGPKVCDPIADAYVNENDSNNHGGEASLAVYFKSSPYQMSKSYIQFNLSGIPKNTSLNVKLRLYLGLLDYIGTINIFEVTSNWSESSISGKKQPSVGGVTIVQKSPSAQGWVDFTSSTLNNLVYAWVNGSKSNYGITLWPQGRTGYIFWSKESMEVPQLVVSW